MATADEFIPQPFTADFLNPDQFRSQLANRARQAAADEAAFQSMRNSSGTPARSTIVAAGRIAANAPMQQNNPAVRSQPLPPSAPASSSSSSMAPATQTARVPRSVKARGAKAQNRLGEFDRLREGVQKQLDFELRGLNDVVSQGGSPDPLAYKRAQERFQNGMSEIDARERGARTDITAVGLRGEYETEQAEKRKAAAQRNAQRAQTTQTTADVKALVGQTTQGKLSALGTPTDTRTRPITPYNVSALPSMPLPSGDGSLPTAQPSRPSRPSGESYEIDPRIRKAISDAYSNPGDALGYLFRSSSREVNNQFILGLQAQPPEEQMRTFEKFVSEANDRPMRDLPMQDELMYARQKALSDQTRASNEASKSDAYRTAEEQITQEYNQRFGHSNWRNYEQSLEEKFKADVERRVQRDAPSDPSLQNAQPIEPLALDQEYKKGFRNLDAQTPGLNLGTQANSALEVLAYTPPFAAAPLSVAVADTLINAEDAGEVATDLAFLYPGLKYLGRNGIKGPGLNAARDLINPQGQLPPGTTQGQIPARRIPPQRQITGPGTPRSEPIIPGAVERNPNRLLPGSTDKLIPNAGGASSQEVSLSKLLRSKVASEGDAAVPPLTSPIPPQTEESRAAADLIMGQVKDRVAQIKDIRNRTNAPPSANTPSPVPAPTSARVGDIPVTETRSKEEIMRLGGYRGPMEPSVKAPDPLEALAKPTQPPTLAKPTQPPQVKVDAGKIAPNQPANQPLTPERFVSTRDSNLSTLEQRQRWIKQNGEATRAETAELNQISPAYYSRTRRNEMKSGGGGLADDSFKDEMEDLTHRTGNKTAEIAERRALKKLIETGRVDADGERLFALEPWQASKDYSNPANIKGPWKHLLAGFEDGLEGAKKK